MGLGLAESFLPVVCHGFGTRPYGWLIRAPVSEDSEHGLDGRYDPTVESVAHD